MCASLGPVKVSGNIVAITGLWEVSGVSGDCTMVVLLQAAQVGGQLQLSSRLNGTVGPTASGRGSRIARNSTTIPLWQRLESIVMDGSAAALVCGTRVSLVAGFRCPCVL